MSRPSVTFVLGSGQLGQVATGNDFISGMILYGTAPGSFATTATQAVFSVADAESKGITLDYADETLATGSLVISSVGSTGDIIQITVPESVPVSSDYPTGVKTVTLCTYTQTSADTTSTLLAASIAAAINANSYLTATGTLTGYTASASTGTITFTARQGLGINLNTNSVTATVTGTIATGTNTAFSGGVYSKKAVWHYQVSEYFRGNPTGKLWIHFRASAQSTFAEVSTIQTAANGEIKQLAIFNPATKTATTFSTDLAALQTQCDTLFTAYTPLVIHYTANTKAISDYSTLVNLQTKSAQNVMEVIMQDGAATGAQLYINSGISMGNVGYTLGTTSALAVNENIGVGTNNISNDVEMAVPALTNGIRMSAVTSGLKDQLDAYRYCFADNQPGVTGTYINEDWTSVISTSDYNRQSRVRVINKAVRLLYANLFPLLKSQIQLNPDGTLTEVAAQTFIGACIPTKAAMANEVSGMSITVNRAQNVINTGKVVIGVRIQPTVSADFIEVDLSFTAKLS